MKSDYVIGKMSKEQNVVSVSYDEDGLFIMTDTAKESRAEELLDMLVSFADFEGDQFHFGIKTLEQLYPNDGLNEQTGRCYAVYAMPLEKYKERNNGSN